jgi:hypothetical protein
LRRNDKKRKYSFANDEIYANEKINEVTHYVTN